MRGHAKASPLASFSNRDQRRGAIEAAPAFLAMLLFGLALLPSLASAAPTRSFEFSFGSFSSPQSIGIDQSGGDVYVIDQGTNTVQRFDSQGEPAPFAASAPYIEGNKLTGNGEVSFSFEEAGFNQVAVDASGGATDGNIYVADNRNGYVEVFSSSGEFLGNLHPEGEGLAAGVTVDNRNGDVYVASSDIDKYVAAGAFPTDADYVSSIAANATQLGVDSEGNLYATGWLFGPITEFDASGAEVKTIPLAPNQSLCGLAVNEITDSVVAIEDSEAFAFGGCRSLPEYDSAGNLTSTLALRGPSFGAAVHAANGNVYVGNLASGAVDVFGPAIDLPTTTEAASAVDSSSGSARLNGTVNPGGSELVDCAFEYGQSQSYGQSVPCAETPAEIGSGEAPVAVHADLGGLDPARYHFRLVATNAIGSVKGSNQAFGISGAETLPAQEVSASGARLWARILPYGNGTNYRFEYGPDTAYGSSAPLHPVSAGSQDPVLVSRLVAGLNPGTTYHFRVVAENSTGRIVGGDRSFATSASKAPTRVFEQVSPVDKEGIGALDRGYAWESSPDGNAVAYTANGAFGDAPAGLFYNWYRADRTSALGWSSRSLDVPQFNQGQLTLAGSITRSEDLSHSTELSQAALAPGAVEGNFNSYLRDNESGELQLIFSTPDIPNMLYGNIRPVGTADFDHVVFSEVGGYAPEATGANNVYEFTDGVLRVVNRLEDGSVVSARLQSEGASDERNSISRDGSRIFFQAEEGTSGVYMRENGTTTVPISASQRTGEVGDVKQANFLDASADGSVVFFRSPVPLTDESDASGWGTYRFNVETEELVDMSVDGGGGSPRPMVFTGSTLASQDGSIAYFWATGALAPDAVEGEMNLYVWSAGELRLVTHQASLFPPRFEISDGGKFAAIESFRPLTGRSEGDNPRCPETSGMPESKGQCRQVFVYDLAADQLECASCRADDQAAAGSATLGIANQGSGPGGATAVLDSGAVFFDSPERLSPNDRNGAIDVYEWGDGESRLISGGYGANASRLMDVSESGRDVFFVTDDQLVGQDDDSSFDAYDARLAGGIPAQNPASPIPPCSGEDCQESIAGRSVRVPGTTAIQGRGESRKRACRGAAAKARRVKAQAKASRKRAQEKKAAQLRRKAKKCAGGAR